LAIKVQVRPNESLEAALRRFKRQCNYSGVFRLAKAKSWHEKRSDKLRRERRERLRTIQRASRLSREVASGRIIRRRAPRSSFSGGGGGGGYGGGGGGGGYGSSS
jgi:small subunit ribosomal protein S21